MCIQTCTLLIILIILLKISIFIFCTAIYGIIACDWILDIWERNRERNIVSDLFPEDEFSWDDIDN
jgi:hypothetical protein